MELTGKLARAARALIELPRDHVARLAGIEEAKLAEFELAGVDPGAATREKLWQVLEGHGAVFLPEEALCGVGVRLKFTAKEVRAIHRMEDEGGPVGSDDV